MNFLLIPTAATSALTTVLEAEPNRFGGADSPDFTQYGILILSLLAAVGFLAWAFKRFFAGSLLRKADERALQIRDCLPLGGKQKLCVVRCYDRSFFLGVSDRHVDLIAELDAAAIGEHEAPLPLEAKHKDAFLRALKRVQQEQLTPQAKPVAKAAPAAPAAPAAKKRTVRRRPATAEAAQQATAAKRPARKPARKRLDDGRGMLA